MYEQARMCKQKPLILNLLAFYYIFVVIYKSQTTFKKLDTKKFTTCLNMSTMKYKIFYVKTKKESVYKRMLPTQTI